MEREVLADYECIRVLGVGSMGTIVLARSITNPARLVAIKRLHPAGSPEMMERIRREAETLQALEHPHIVRVLDVIDDRGGVALVLQYAPNGTLADHLVRSKTLSPTESIAVLAPLADALSYAHEKNVLHRDVKPSNILFTADDLPLLADFGIARWDHHPTLTTAGGALGSAAFFDPALADGESPAPHNDLYACGIIGYLCLTGQLPFQGSTPLATIRLADEGTHEPLSSKQFGPMAHVLERAFARDPGDRWPDLRSFSDALQNLQTPPPPPTNAAPPSPHPQRHGQLAAHVETNGLKEPASPPADLMPEPPGTDPSPTIRFERNRVRQSDAVLPTPNPTNRDRRRKMILIGVSAVLVGGLAVGIQVLREPRSAALRPLPLAKLPACVPETTQQCVRSYAQTPYGMRVTFEDGSTGQYRAGLPGDVARVDNWFCGRRATLAVYRPTTGQLFVADRWPDPLDPSPVRVIRLDTGIRNADVSQGPGNKDACADLAFDRGSTRTWFYPNAQLTTAQPVQVVPELDTNDTTTNFLFARIEGSMATASPNETPASKSDPRTLLRQAAPPEQDGMPTVTATDDELLFSSPLANPQQETSPNADRPSVKEPPSVETGPELDDAVSPPPVDQLESDDVTNTAVPPSAPVATLPPPGPKPTASAVRAPDSREAPTATQRRPGSSSTVPPGTSETPLNTTAKASQAVSSTAQPKTNTASTAQPKANTAKPVTNTAKPIPNTAKQRAKKSKVTSSTSKTKPQTRLAPGPGFDGRTFNLGVIANTGDPVLGPTAKATLAGIKARVAMINSAGGLGGSYPVNLQIVPPAGTPGAALSAWKANNGAVAAWISIGGRGTYEALEPSIRADQSVASFSTLSWTPLASQANLPASTPTEFGVLNAIGYLNEQSKNHLQTTCALTTLDGATSGLTDTINYAANRLAFAVGPTITLPSSDAASAVTVATAAVQALRSANCTAVVLDVLPTQTADVLLTSRQLGLTPRWIVLSGSFRPDVLPSATGPILEESAIVVGDGTDWAVPNAPENANLRTWLSSTGDSSFLDLQTQGLHLGWQQAKALQVLLEQAIRQNDVSRTSLYRLANELRAATFSNPTTQAEIASIKTTLFAVDFSSPGGVRVLTRNYVSPTTELFRASLGPKTPTTAPQRRGGQQL